MFVHYLRLQSRFFLIVSYVLLGYRFREEAVVAAMEQQFDWYEEKG